MIAPAAPRLTKARFARLVFLLGVVDRGLKGQPFACVRLSSLSPLRAIGVELVTSAQAAARGHRIRPHAKPVGRIQQKGDASKTKAQLYVLGVQTMPKTSTARKGPRARKAEQLDLYRRPEPTARAA